MTIVNAWNLTTVDGKPYVVAVTDTGMTLLQFGAGLTAVVDPDALSGVLAQVNGALALMRQTICTITKHLTTDTLTCTLPMGHPQPFHLDPSGAYWHDTE